MAAAMDELELAMGEAFSALTPLSFMAMVSQGGARCQGQLGGGPFWRRLRATAGKSATAYKKGEGEGARREQQAGAQLCMLFERRRQRKRRDSSLGPTVRAAE